MQSALLHIKTEMNSSLLFSEQSLQRATMAYDQMRTKIFEEKDKVGKDIFYVLEELINFKTFVESSLIETQNALVKGASK